MEDKVNYHAILCVVLGVSVDLFKIADPLKREPSKYLIHPNKIKIGSMTLRFSSSDASYEIYIYMCIYKSKFYNTVKIVTILIFIKIRFSVESFLPNNNMTHYSYQIYNKAGDL